MGANFFCLDTSPIFSASLGMKTVCCLLLLGLAQADINVIPPREECAKTGANCVAQKCCQTTGYECYEVHSGFAQCMKSCTPGQDGTCLKNAPAMVPSKQSDVTYAKNTLFWGILHSRHWQ